VCPRQERNAEVQQLPPGVVPHIPSARDKRGCDTRYGCHRSSSDCATRKSTMPSTKAISHLGQISSWPNVSHNEESVTSNDTAPLVARSKPNAHLFDPDHLSMKGVFGLVYSWHDVMKGKDACNHARLITGMWTRKLRVVCFFGHITSSRTRRQRSPTKPAWEDTSCTSAS